MMTLPDPITLADEFMCWIFVLGHVLVVMGLRGCGCRVD